MSSVRDPSPTRLARLALIGFLIAGCIAVLWPFIGAVLFALVLWICTWPFYARQVLPRLKGRSGRAATVMTLGLIAVLLVPMVFLSGGLVDGVDTLVAQSRPYIEQGLPAEPPAFVKKIPVVGGDLDERWRKAAGSREELNKLMRPLLEPAPKLALSLGGVVANGLLQLSLVLFIVFFLYRDGEAIGKAFSAAARKLGGELGEHMLELARGTVIGVMLGLVGTAAAQGAVALIGFLIAGVPAAVLLGFATFFLSLIPAGPVLLWGGAAWWLYDSGQTGWAIFMVAWGVLVISSIDNFVKPILISRGAGISIALIALGVLGGVMVFGFIGIFLGPVLLALGHAMIAAWTREEAPT
ncbi:MAG: AI-2E family transporter [Dechloromonas sp.]|jgi:predicted PurR-regulated permease PerM|nr:AI-2E family transporter [Dechloromonas sp.]